MNDLFRKIFYPVFAETGIGVVLPSGAILCPAMDGVPTVTFHRNRDLLRFIFSPELAFFEAFASNHITITNGRIYDVLIRVTTARVGNLSTFNIAKLFNRLSTPFFQFAEGVTPKKSKKNVHAHYDLGNDFYRLFLDDDLQYSCAYFANTDDDLSTAQRNKKEHIIRKLAPEPDLKVLDIGCGWGGLSLDLAERGVSITGLTLSEEQFALAKERSANRSLDVNFKLQDYRLETDTYDRIVSVGMFEHVGPRNFQKYFDQISKNLKDDGIALVHTIGRPTPPTLVNRFTTKYIFPGGYIPSLSQITAAVERTDLIVTDVECLYQHYAETLKHWRIKFLQNRDKVVTMYDEHFALIWECYLAGSEALFRNNDLLVFQIQLKKVTSPTTLTRDYLYQ